MKIKTTDLVKKPLNWAVAKCEGVRVEDLRSAGSGFELLLRDLDGNLNGRYQTGVCQYSSNWLLGGQIIEREKIDLQYSFATGKWEACVVASDDSGIWYLQGPTALVAAMRCRVASVLGDAVDVPEDLV